MSPGRSPRLPDEDGSPGFPTPPALSQPVGAGDGRIWDSLSRRPAWLVGWKVTTHRPGHDRESEEGRTHWQSGGWVWLPTCLVRLGQCYAMFVFKIMR